MSNGPRNGSSEFKRSSTKPSRRKPCTKQRWPKGNAGWQFSKQRSGPTRNFSRVGEANPCPARQRGPEEILNELEATLTRLDSSDEEPLLRPVSGRNVVWRFRTQWKATVIWVQVSRRVCAELCEQQVSISFTDNSPHSTCSDDVVASAQRFRVCWKRQVVRWS